MKIYKKKSNETPKVQNITEKDGLFGEFSQKKIKFLICVTIYNEKATLLENTINGIYENLKSLEQIHQI